VQIRFKNLPSRLEELGERVDCQPGEKIIIQGQECPFFYFVKSGRVEVYPEGPVKNVLAVLSAGEYFGEVPCLTGSGSAATYAAGGRAGLIRTDREGLLRLMADLPDFNQQVVDTLCRIIRRENPGHAGLATEAGETRDRAKPFAEAPDHLGRPVIGLALGAGVVRGMAHIGVIRSLVKNNIPIDLVAGTSAGAMVGACLAAGRSVEEIESFALRLRWSKVASPVIPPGRAFLNNEKLGQLVKSFIGDITFQELDIPLAVVAADSGTGEEVIIREGSITDAIRASTAIPAIFEPVRLYNRTLVDGGTVNMVPASVCRAMGANIVIAVSVSDFHYQQGPPRNIVLAIMRTFDLVTKKQVALAKNQWADVVIDVKRPDLSGYSFREAKHFIREGEKRADRMMPVIKNLIGQWNANRHCF